ncbi:MAG: gliding motility protein GldB [Bergeyella sp.]
MKFDVKIMKFFRNMAVVSVFVFSFQSCKKEAVKNWNAEIKNPVQNIEFTDLSKELYDPAVSLETFKSKYPWFQGTVTDEDFEIRRKDPEEIKIYKEAIAKIDQTKLKKELTSLFSHIAFYFPEFKAPKVYLYSSALQGISEPIIYHPQNNFLFIDITGFMGEKDANYKGVETYFTLSMNPSNIVPKVSQILAEQFVPYDAGHQKFIDLIVYQGKLMTLQDAFLPELPDYLKINYTKEQYDWAVSNEVNIWDYFVENDLIFSDDERLTDRFIAPGPFSKFYTEIDNESSPQVGIFTGWQICRKFYKEKPETPLADFLKMDAQTIFNQAVYKPKYTE